MYIRHHEYTHTHKKAGACDNHMHHCAPFTLRCGASGPTGTGAGALRSVPPWAAVTGGRSRSRLCSGTPGSTLQQWHQGAADAAAGEIACVRLPTVVEQVAVLCLQVVQHAATTTTTTSSGLWTAGRVRVQSAWDSTSECFAFT